MRRGTVVLLLAAAAAAVSAQDARYTEGRAIPERVASDEVPVLVTNAAGRAKALYTPLPAAAQRPRDPKRAREVVAADGVTETAFVVTASFEITNFLYTYYTLNNSTQQKTRSLLVQDVARNLAVAKRFVRVSQVAGVRHETPGAAREEGLPASAKQRLLARYRRQKPHGPEMALVEFDAISGVTVNVTVFTRTPMWGAKVARDLFNRLGKREFPVERLMRLPLDARGNNARPFSVDRGSWGVTFGGERVERVEQIEQIRARLQEEYKDAVRLDAHEIWKDLSVEKWRVDAGTRKALKVVPKPVLEPYEQSLRIDSLHEAGATVSRLLADGFDGHHFRFAINYYDDSVGDQRNDWVGLGSAAFGGRSPIYHDYVIGLFHDPFHYSTYPDWRPTPVRRTVGWHRFEFIGNDKEVHYFIDGQHVHTRPATGRKLVGFTLRGNGGTTAYWSPWEFFKPVPISNW